MKFFRFVSVLFVAAHLHRYASSVNMMITKEQVMPLFLQACPSFAAKLGDRGFNDKNSLYTDLGNLAHHIVELHETNQTSELPAVFEVIERLHLDGDDSAKEAATIAILENIQNIAGNSTIDPEDFTHYLQPESAKWWHELNDFWNGKILFVGARKNEA